MFETIWQDLRYARRVLAKNPGFALVALLSVAIGVGANAAMFSITDGLILRPLPVPDASGLVRLRTTSPTGDVRSGISYPDYIDVRDRSRRFEGLAAFRGVVASFGRRRDEPAQGKYGLAVSGNFFDVLHLRPVLGRAFVPDEDRVAGRDAVVVLAYETWTEQFASDPAIVGRQIRIAGEPFTVIGVAPQGFNGPEHFVPSLYYIPMAMLPTIDVTRANILEDRDNRVLNIIGRLKPGTSVAQASEESGLLGRALEREHPTTNARWGLLVRTEQDTRFAEYAPMRALGLILIGLAIAVLAVACANVAGLLASRAPVRAREIALRLAIGGSRPRVIRQLITESALTAAIGGLAGLLVAYGIILSFRQFQIATDVGVRLIYELDRRAIIVGLAVAAISTILSSAIPAWRSARATDLSTTLRNTTQSAGATARLWGRHGLVAAQIALTLVLLTVAMSFYRAFQAEYGRGPGFRTERILLTNLNPSLVRYDQRQTDTFYQRLKDRVAAIPGVSSVALTSFVPLNADGQEQISIVPDGFVLPPGTLNVRVFSARVDEHYFDTLGISMVGGRAFGSSDTADSPRVAIVSRGMAAKYWPGENPLGKRIRIADATGAQVEVVGVAEDAKFRLFTANSTPFLYLPLVQNPVMRQTLVVRTDVQSNAIAAPVRAAILETDQDVPILSMRTIEAFYDSNTRNLNAVVVRTVAGMGTMGLALALIGLYGLTAYAASRRTREIGIRIAVGALPSSVLRMILRQGTLPAIGGVAVGVIASAAVGGLIQGLFPGTAADLVTFLLIVPVVVTVVLLAAYIPARRAARIDPLVALRQD